MKTNQVTVADLKAFNMAWKELNSHGEDVNRIIADAEKSMVFRSQIGQESAIGSFITAYLAMYIGLNALIALIVHFSSKADDFIGLFKKYADTTLKKLALVDQNYFGKQTIKGYKYDRFVQVGKALVAIGGFVEANISKLDKEEVIWSEKIFPNMRVAVIGNDIHAPGGESQINPGWEKGSMNDLGWTTDKLAGVVSVVKAVLATNTKFDHNTWGHLHQVADSVHNEQRALNRMKTDDEKHEAEKHLAVVRKNFYNFRYVIQIYMYFSSHFLAEFFAICGKAQKSIK